MISANDHAAIVDAVYRLGLYADELRWDDLLTLLAEDVRLDYTSMVGGVAAVVKGTELISGWRSYLPGFDSTQHVIAGVIVDADGDDVAARAQLSATFRIDEQGVQRLWHVAGLYAFTLRRVGGAWRFVALTLKVAWDAGDPALRDVAAHRVRLGTAKRR
jgi:hypothetical protein